MAQVQPSPAVVLAMPPREQPPPPIASLLPLLVSVGSWTFYGATKLYNLISFYLLSPLFFIISIVLYLLSPILVSTQVILNLFVSDPLYPIYAFIGAACLLGIIFGFGARYLVRTLGQALLEKMMHNVPPQRSVSPTRPRPPRKASTRGKRKVTVKTED
ncbi:hypothetical protein BGW80DRAFT_1304513 [Lactifluus volemus]|nr:hypothetical protein BGW80DRAFT_1304513 [Lactifluus volemus]